MKIACANRLSPFKRGEEEDEGFQRTRLLTLTLSLSLIKGEATPDAHGHSKISAQK
jgi:hypothetical protein